MPAINKTTTVPGGNTSEFLETSQMTQGAYVRMLATSPPGGVRAGPHLHLCQEEKFEVQAGRLTYWVGKKRPSSVGPGETVVLPAGVPHEHWNAGDELLITRWTITPGLDFDYLLETSNGLAIEAKIPRSNRPLVRDGFYKTPVLQGLVWIRKMKSGIAVPGIPVWLQKAMAFLLTPLAYRLGYRAVYKRFSGAEW